MRVIFDHSILDRLKDVVIHVGSDDFYNKDKFQNNLNKYDIPFISVKFDLFYNLLNSTDEEMFIWKKNGKYVCVFANMSFRTFKNINYNYFKKRSS